jgi:hypothetical protein
MLFPENTFSALQQITVKGGPKGVDHPRTEFSKSGLQTTGDEFDSAVKQVMEKNRNMTYSQAMDFVNRERPELYRRS